MSDPVISEEIKQNLMLVGNLAWQKGLLAGFNGNLSGRSGQFCFITCASCIKGMLSDNDLTSLVIPDLQSDIIDLIALKKCSIKEPSSEFAMHLSIYQNQVDAKAIIHVHPPALLALSLLLDFSACSIDKVLYLPLYEYKKIISELGLVSTFEPGTNELAFAVGKEAKKFKAIFMLGHGLTVWGNNLKQAFALAEEIEHLAKIKIATLTARC